MSTQQITSIPYANSTGVLSLRLIVKPIPLPEQYTENGLLLPVDAGRICETGIVISVSHGSTICIGDTIEYKKIDRRNPGEKSIINIDEEDHDLIFENEVWSVNERPFNRIFIEPLSTLVATEEGIIIPDATRGFPQKGIVHAVPADSLFREGDTVEYRYPEQGMYPQVNVNGRIMHVLFERDIFTVNGAVSPYKIIVKIDLMAQRLKRQFMDNGLERSPLFLFMMHNLQYGQVMGIGSEAQKLYPELGVNDFAVLHHTVEHQPHRILKQKKGGSGMVTHEYRIINCFNHDGREIFGHMKSLQNKPLPHSIKLFGGQKLVEWDFDLFEKKEEPESLLEVKTVNFNDIHNLDVLLQTVEESKKKGAEKSKMEYNRIVAKLGNLNPEIPAQKSHINILETQIEDLRRTTIKQASYVQKNHLITSKEAYGKEQFVFFYQQAYPISLFDKKYIIIHPGFIIGTIKKSEMADTAIFQPFGDQVQIAPINRTQESQLILPENSIERPIEGMVISVGPGTDKCQMIVNRGQTVYFKRMAGTEVTIEGVEYLIMRQNDLLGFIK